MSSAPERSPDFSVRIEEQPARRFAPAAGPRSLDEIRNWLIARLSEILRIESDSIDIEAPFSTFGLSSVAGVELSGEIECWLGRPVSPLLAYEYPSIETLARCLADEPRPAPLSHKPRLIRESPAEPAAVIGMACRFPGVSSPEEFWQALRSGRDLIQEVPPDRWDLDQFYDPRPRQPGKMRTRCGGFIRDADAFDSDFFGISRREAAQMDPQQRVLLEVAWEALENAGVPPGTLAGTSTGVFVGISSSDHLLLQTRQSPPIDFYAATGGAHSIAANRISYFLDLRGPSIAVDTACSSSLAAVDLALQSLNRGACDTALVAGANLVLAPYGAIAFSQAGAMAADGRCKPFDARADGYVRSEGIGVIVLRRLADAIRRNDPVLAVVRGSAMNQDGRTNGMTAPNGAAQRSVVAEALETAGVAPSQIGYVEAHGTGTVLGDPIEFEALRAVLGQDRARDQICFLGSVKANIGHLEAAAGIAGLIKAILVLQHKEIPPQIHFKTANPEIPLEATPFRISTQCEPWPSAASPRMAGVSSFGFGGTNVHVIVAEGVETAVEPSPVDRPVHLLALSARTDAALKRLAQRYTDWFAEHPEASLPDVCFSANTGRSSLERRVAFAASDMTQIKPQLAGYLSQQPAAAGKRPNPAPKIAFLFPGQGCQYLGMAAGLYRSQPVFRDAFDYSANQALEYLETPLQSLLFEKESADRAALLNRPMYAQIALFTLGYALNQTWRSWGVKPDFVIGHSAGEYTAACVAGVVTVEDGLKLLAERARYLEALPKGGLMAAVFADEARVTEYLRDATDVVIAAINSPQNTVLSGRELALKEILERLAADGVESSLLGVPLASHSPLVDPILDGFEASARQISFQRPQLGFASTLTGSVWEQDRVPDARHWRTHLREPVQFARCVTSVMEHGVDLFVELGPTSLLTSIGISGFPSGRIWLPSLQRQADDWQILSSTLASLYESGAAIDWHGFDRPYPRRRLVLPNYPFARNSFSWNKPEYLDRGSVPEPVAPAPVTHAPKCSDRRQAIALQLQELIAVLLGEAAADVDVSTSFLMMGADSIMLAKALQSIESKFGVNVAPRQMFVGLENIEKLAAYIDEKMPLEPEVQVQPPVQPKAQPEAVLRPVPAVPGASTSQAGKLGDEIEASGLLSESAIERIMQRQLEAIAQVAAAQIAALGRPTSPRPPAQPARAADSSPLPAGSASSSAKTQNLEKSESLGLALPAAALSEPEMLDEDTAARRAHLKQFVARYSERTKTSKRLAGESRVNHADFRNSVKVTQRTKELRYQIVADRARGSRFWDVDGNEYVDLTMGFGVNLFGHSPDFLTKAIRDQLDEGMFLGPLSGLAIETGKLICELTGSERVLFSNTGTEAVMAALRLARAVTSRHKVVMFDGSYHGGFDAVLGLAAEDAESPAIPGMPGVAESMLQDTYVLEYGSDRALEFVERHREELAAVIVEPVQSRRPGLQPRDFLVKLRGLTEKAGTALIFDEAVTGFRIHPGGAQAFFDVRADMAVYGKILGGGMPIGVVAGNSRFLDAVDGGAWSFGDQSLPRKTKTFIAGTFCKHPLAMAAAGAVLRRLAAEGPALQIRLNQRTGLLAGGLNRFFESRALPLHVDTFGSLFRVMAPFQVGRSVDMDLLFYHLAYRGVYVWEGRTCFLSTAHTDADIDRISEGIQESIAELQAAGYFSTGGAARPSAAAKPEEHQQTSYPLTEAQEQMWVLSVVGKAGFEPTAVRVKGPLDLGALRQSVQEVARRHESLRTVFGDKGASQTVLADFAVDVPLFDMSAFPPPARETEVTELLEREARRAFDLAAAPPWRVTIIRTGRDCHLLVLTAHHIIVDGWSSVVLLKEVFDFYSALSSGATPRLPAPAQFRQYVAWLDDRLKSADLQNSEAYWLARFSRPLPDVQLPADRRRRGVKSYQGAREVAMIDGATLSGLKSLARRENCTLFMVLFAAYGVLLHRLTQRPEIVAGFAVSGRSMAGSESMIGYCNHLLPIRLTAEQSVDFTSYLTAVRNHILEAYDHQQYPFARLLNKLNIGRDPNQPPLLTSTFNLEPPISLPQVPKLTVELAPSPIGFTGGDIHLNVTELDDQLLLHIDFDRDLFERATIARMLGQYGVILDSIIRPGPQSLWTLPVLTAAERGMLLGSLEEAS